MNPLAKIRRTERSQIPVAELLDIKAHALQNALRLHDDHDHGHDHEHAHHDEHVRSFYIVDDRPLDLRKLEAWLSDVIQTMGPQIYRAKGILHINGQPKRVVFQGVQMLFDAAPDRFWNPGEKRQNQLVFIGKDLDEGAIRAGFANCIA
jgi:G3E family GTPase